MKQAHITGLYLLECETQAIKAAKHPSFPPEYIVKPKFSDKTTNELTRAVLQKLRNDGAFASRINSTGIYRGEGKGWTTGTTVNGFPDIVGCLPDGTFISVEVKCAATNDRLSDSQKEVGNAIQEAKGVWMVATTYDRWLIEYSIIKKQKGL